MKLMHVAFETTVMGGAGEEASKLHLTKLNKFQVKRMAQMCLRKHFLMTTKACLM